MTDNIFLDFSPESINYTPSGRASKSLPTRNRITHAEKLKNELENIWIEVKKETDRRLAVQLPVKNGTYIEFIGEPGFTLEIKSLENKRLGIKLLNVRRYDVIENDEDKELIKATVFIPVGKEQFFLDRIIRYQKEDTPSSKPKHKDLIETISSIKQAVLECFWIGDHRHIPKDNPIWCEVWLRNDLDDKDYIDPEGIFREALKDLQIESRAETIRFPELKVILIKASYPNLIELLSRNEYITEIKRATEAISFFTELKHEEQIKWAKELLDRVKIRESNVVVSILDSGVNNGNILLNNIMHHSDIHSYFGDSGHDHSGHGTKMAGVALYGDLKVALENMEDMQLSHSLESIKVLPEGDKNEPELYGSITSDSISNLYIDAEVNRQRIICMAITTESYSILDGRPSSWSAAIDDTIAGSVDEIHKLFLVSAGNIRGPEDLFNYPDINRTETIEDPGQSWNAITVGAYTDLDKVPSLEYELLAKKGQLSPFSRTSMLFDKRWPIKPEIVLEGGNAIKLGQAAFDDENLSLLTTHHDPTEAVFTHINATSAATASASWMAAKIQAKYPKAWPETVRALLIHSAEWTEEMIEQFLNGDHKGAYQELLRTCGYGVPNLNRAIDTAENRVNLIIQSELQPFDKINSSYKTKDMHIHELPWPKELLQEIFDKEVKMKVTLSYFIESGPGEKGWQDKYRYASAGLRFDLNGTNNKEDFIERINKAVREDGYQRIEPNINWKLGPDNRNVGSIHSDTWVGSGADLAMSNYIGIYPVIGWWRERHHLGKWHKKIRYSLVVSLSTPEKDIDLLTPIMNEIRARIETPVEIDIEF